MTTRRAKCNYGQPHLTCEGEPMWIPVCYSSPVSDGREVSSAAKRNSIGHSLTFQFCLIFGFTVYWAAA